MNELLRKYVGMCEAGEIRSGDKLPMAFTYKELEYLYMHGYIIEDNNTFIAIATDGFEG